MIDLERPESRSISYLSPTAFEIGQACPLRLAFRQHTQGRAGKRNPALRLGDVCHHVLDRLIGHWLTHGGEDWDTTIEELWTEEIGREAEESEHAGELLLYGPPERWPAYQLKRVRLVRVARRLRLLLEDLPPEAVIHPEHELLAFDGKLRGRIDLLINHQGSHRLVDYKSGTAVDRQTLDVRESYARQLQLYAVLVAENFGDWPASAQLIPLEGPTVDVDLDEATSRAVAQSALELLEGFNMSVPVAPASPGPGSCPACSYSTRCPELWAEIDLTWASAFLAVRGTARRVTRTPLGGTSITVEVAGGSMSTPIVEIRGIDEIAHPDAVSAEEGCEVIAVGLSPLQRQDGHRLGFTGTLRVG